MRSLAATAKRLKRSGLAALAAAVLAGCQSAPPALDKSTVRADPRLMRAAESVVMRIQPNDDDGASLSAGSAVMLGPRAAVTVAHGVIGKAAFDAAGEKLVLLDGRPVFVSVRCSGLDDPGVSAGARATGRGIPAEHDWLMIDIRSRDEAAGTLAAADAAPAAGGPVFARARVGDRVVIIGYPKRYLPEGWQADLSWPPPASPAWQPPEPVFIPGTVHRVGEGVFRVRLASNLGTLGGGLSGGGVFVEREDGYALAGIASKTSSFGPWLMATAPTEGLSRCGGVGSTDLD